MINNNKQEFMNTVSMKADDFKKRSFEACMQSFLKSVITKSTVVDVSDQLDLNDKTKMVDVVTSTIKNVSKEIIENSSLKDETNALYDVNIAGEIENPQTLAEKAAKNISEAVKSEADDRKDILSAKFDCGEFKTLSPEQVLEKVDESFESVTFSKSNSKNLSQKMKMLLSIEGQDLVESIKSDVLNVVNETEAKNTIVREAIGEINKRKDQIEDEINGDESKDTDNEESQQDNNDTSSDEQNDKDMEQNSSEALNRCRRAFKSKPVITINDLVFNTSSNTNSVEGLNIDSEYDKLSFSREEAETILDEFRESEDGIDTDNVENSENTLSVSNNNENDSFLLDDNDKTTKSSENEYTNDEGEVIEVNNAAFNYGTEENPEISPDEISEEALAKLILPLSINKFRNNTPLINEKNLTCFLAAKEDHGEEFFRCIDGRVKMFVNIMSNENIADDDPINDKLKNVIDTNNNIKTNVETLVNDLGILGILDGKYQRTDSICDNAVKSVINDAIVSKESLNDLKNDKDSMISKYADIFKLAITIDDITKEISNNIDVYGNREKLGDIEELLNEKMMEVEDPADRVDIESKIKSLQSIESIVPFEDIINMQVFVSNSNEKPDKVSVNSFKDIDAYGYCYCDEVADIEKKISDKYSDFIKNNNIINVNVHELVNYVAEEKDTTKLNSNFYENIISKLVENKTINNSTEALIYRNKAKAMVTGFIAADKLGFLGENDVQKVMNDAL